MIRGLDYAEFTTTTDIQRMVNEQQQVDFVWIRARQGFKDDSKYRKHSAELVKATNKDGAVLWGPYIYLNYAPGAPEGDDQAADAWQMTTAAGRQWQLPMAIDCERSQSGPLPPVKTYFDTLLMPAINVLSDKLGRRPVLYSNPDFLLNYAKPLLYMPEYRAVGECPLWIANYSKTGTPPYWTNIYALGLWKSWLAWQHAPSVSDWPGVSNVDLNWGAGTRAQWKAWATAGGPLPVEGAVEPPPPPPPPADPPSDIEARLSRLERIADHHKLTEA